MNFHDAFAEIVPALKESIHFEDLPDDAPRLKRDASNRARLAMRRGAEQWTDRRCKYAAPANGTELPANFHVARASFVIRESDWNIDRHEREIRHPSKKIRDGVDHKRADIA